MICKIMKIKNKYLSVVLGYFTILYQLLMGSKWILGRMAGRAYVGFSWLRIGTGGGLL
jgi:hypothetical protein